MTTREKQFYSVSQWDYFQVQKAFRNVTWTILVQALVHVYVCANTCMLRYIDQNFHSQLYWQSFIKKQILLRTNLITMITHGTNSIHMKYIC